MNRRTLLMSASTAVAGLVLSGCGSSDNDSSAGGGHDSHGSTATSANSSSANAGAARKGDIAFAQGMIPHHKQAIDMADIALKKPSASVEVRKLATAIRKAQDPEIKTMTGWLTSWGAPTSMPSMSEHGGHQMDGMMTPAEMASLKKADGTVFDRQWMRLMIKHHKGAVQMAGDVKKTTRDPKVRGMANAIIKGQNAEIRTMQRHLGDPS